MCHPDGPGDGRGCSEAAARSSGRCSDEHKVAFREMADDQDGDSDDEQSATAMLKIPRAWLPTTRRWCTDRLR